MTMSKARHSGAVVHTPGNDGREPPAFLPGMLDTMEHWITERELVRQRKEACRPKPWTDDPVLRDNRFCNVRRMDDKVSVWLLDNWYDGLHKSSGRVLVTMATLARHINWPDTLCELDQYVRHSTPEAKKWQPEAVLRILEQRKARGQKVFTGAYIINGATGTGSKIFQVVERVDAVWKLGSTPWAVDNLTMGGAHAVLNNIHGIGSFMAGQIVADLRHTHLLGSAPDAMLWAPRGPGSQRGMNRLLGRDVSRSGFSDVVWQHTITSLWRVLYARRAVRRVFDSRRCELMDLQNCLCEFDKYVRVSTGQGRARNGYPGKA